MLPRFRPRSVPLRVDEAGDRQLARSCGLTTRSRSIADHHIGRNHKTNSTTFSFERTCPMEVIVGDHEPLDEALKRFRRKVVRSGLLREMRQRTAYEKPAERRKRKAREAAMRRRCMALRGDDFWGD